MILGMSLPTFTLVHVIISLIGIVTGLLVLHGMFSSDMVPGWTAGYLVTTILTSVTGYFFPFTKILPSHIVGAISLVVLAIAVIGYCAYRLAGAWRGVYAAAAIFALYLNMFVLVVQLFLKVPALHALAPTQQSPAFVVTQGVVLVVFACLGYKAVRAFHPEVGMTGVPAR